MPGTGDTRCEFSCCADKRRQEYEPEIIGDIVIPTPTAEDMEWKYILDQSREEYNFDHFETWRNASVYKETNLWRVKYLIDNGKEIDNNRGKALYNAVVHDQHNLIRLLILKGANVNVYCGQHLVKSAIDKNKKAFHSFLKLGADINLAFKHAKPDELRALAEMTGRKAHYWEKQDDQTILRRHFEQDGDVTYKIRTVFNFESRKIKIYTEQGKHKFEPRFEKFSDQETLNEIDEAYQKLLEMDGMPTPPENYNCRSQKAAPSVNPVLKGRAP